jgi:membrane-associated phospholipid phosphatase
MRLPNIASTLALAMSIGATSIWLPATAQAQSALNLHALELLAPFSALLNTQAGKAALAANLEVTGAIQNGTSSQPGLQSFPNAQAQALKDATITGANGYELADGLGSKLGGAYQSRTSVGKPGAGDIKASATNISPSLAVLFGYASGLTGADSNSAKYFFADENVVKKTETVPVSAAAAAIITAARGTTDVFGKAYNDPAGAKGADPFGDSRPFQTEPKVTKYADPDFFGDPSDNQDYLTGPTQNLLESPSFPSGHTTYGYTESLLFAVMVPERFTQMVTRGAEYGNSRIIVGAHYTMDVIGGRTLATYDVAHLLANSPAYLGQKAPKSKTIKNFQAALKAAKADLRTALEKACGGSVSSCAAEDSSRFANPAANQAFYESTQTYGLPVVYPAMAGKTEDVGKLAPEAGYILTTAFPRLTLKQADHILTQTEGPGGGFLDDGSAFGVYSRLDLYKAGLEAQAYK